MVLEGHVTSLVPRPSKLETGKAWEWGYHVTILCEIFTRTVQYTSKNEWIHLNSWECTGVNGEPCSYKKKSRIFFNASYTTVRISTIQVMYQYYNSCISRSHTHNVWMWNEIRDLYNKRITTIVPSYIVRLLRLGLLFVLWTHNNTDGNQLVIFFGIAVHCGLADDAWL